MPKTRCFAPRKIGPGNLEPNEPRNLRLTFFRGEQIPPPAMRLSRMMNGCSRCALAAAVLREWKGIASADLRAAPSATGSWPPEARGSASAGPLGTDGRVVVHVFCT
jgi:hypothetical protein